MTTMWHFVQKPGIDVYVDVLQWAVGGSYHPEVGLVVMLGPLVVCVWPKKLAQEAK